MSFAPRIASAAVIAAAVGSAVTSPSMAQEPSAAALTYLFMARDPVVVDIPEAELPSVQPALTAYVLAVERIQAERVSGSRATLSQEFQVAAQARQNLISAQLDANQALMPRLQANARPILVARDRELIAQAASTRAQERQLAALGTGVPAVGASGTAGVAVAAPEALAASKQDLSAVERAYAAATERLQADQAGGNSGAVALDAAAVQQAQQALFSAELTAGPSAQPQLAAAARAARQSLLFATQRLTADKADGNTGAMAQDGVMVDLANQALANAQAAADPRATTTGFRARAARRWATASPRPATIAPRGVTAVPQPAVQARAGLSLARGR